MAFQCDEPWGCTMRNRFSIPQHIFHGTSSQQQVLRLSLAGIGARLFCAKNKHTHGKLHKCLSFRNLDEMGLGRHAVIDSPTPTTPLFYQNMLDPFSIVSVTPVTPYTITAKLILSLIHI